MYIATMLNQKGASDNSKKACFAALKYKLVTCEGRKDISFPKLKGKSRQKNPHRYFDQVQLAHIFEIAKSDTSIEVLVHLLYDMAARMQDIIGLTGVQVQAILATKSAAGALINLQPRKSANLRVVYLQSCTV